MPVPITSNVRQVLGSRWVSLSFVTKSIYSAQPLSFFPSHFICVHKKENKKINLVLFHLQVDQSFRSQ